MKTLSGYIKRVIKSIRIGFELVAICSTIAGVLGFTIRDIKEKMTLWDSLLILFLAIAVFSIVIFIGLFIKSKRGFDLKINGKTVSIRVGDIFTETGWKVIPCNEYFDTTVDDRIIAQNTLNGRMICEHINDVNDLNRAIESAQDDSSPLMPTDRSGRKVYPLGRIIPYNDFLMLAFTHFNQQNEAYIEISEYESCLMKMWGELRRVYAAKHICIPLIGAGITDINGMNIKDNTTLLKCILCTMRSSGFAPDSGLEIVLTQGAFDSIDTDRIREEF